MAETWSGESSVVSLGKFSKKVRVQAQPMMKFEQFCLTKEEFGAGKGAVVIYDKFSNLTTAGGTLVETSTMPVHTLNVTQGTLTVTEYGAAIEWTGKLVALSEITLKPQYRTALANDQAKVLNAAVEAQMDLCNYRYVAGTADGVGAFTTNGTATATAASNLGKGHVKKIVDKLKELNAPPIDGSNYVGILSIAAHGGIYDDLEEIWKYTKYPTAGEAGRYYRTRMVEDNQALDNSIGTADVTGEAYFFGYEAVMAGVAIIPEIRVKERTDYGRTDGVAWYSILGYGLMWGGSDPDNRVIKFTSA